jgi:hypothetical protein
MLLSAKPSADLKEAIKTKIKHKGGLISSTRQKYLSDNFESGS